MSQDLKLALIIEARNNAQAALDKLNAGLGETQRESQGVEKGFGGMEAAGSRLKTVIGGLVSVAALAGLYNKIKEINLEAGEWQRRELRTEQLVRATGNAAGYTAEELSRLAEQRDLATLGDKEGILDAINVLQTFRSISGTTFKEALTLSQDLSTVFGTDLRSSAVQLGKALEDPIQGINALRRSGVSFTDQQKEQIQSLVESGQQFKAQALILAEVKKQVGGASEAEAGGLIGAVDTLTFRWRDLREEFANTDAATAEVDNLAASVSNLTRLVRDLKGLGNWFTGVGDTMMAATGFDDFETAYELQDALNPPIDTSQAEADVAGLAAALARRNNREAELAAKVKAEQEKKAAEDAKKLAKKLQQANDEWNLKQAKKETDALETSLGALLADFDLLSPTLEDGLGALEDYSGQLQLTGEGIETLSSGVRKFSYQVTDWQDSLQMSFQSFGDGFTQATARFLSEGKEAWEDYFSYIAQQLAALAVQEWITNPLFSALASGLSGLFGGSSSASAAGAAFDTSGFNLDTGLDYSSLFASAQGNVFASPGLHAYANRVVYRPTVFPFAKGIGLMGEAGPEAIMPLTRMAGGDLGVRVAGMGTQITNHFTIDARGADASVSMRIEAAVERATEQAYQKVLRDSKRGGAIWRANR